VENYFVRIFLDGRHLYHHRLIRIEDLKPRVVFDRIRAAHYAAKRDMEAISAVESELWVDESLFHAY